MPSFRFSHMFIVHSFGFGLKRRSCSQDAHELFHVLTSSLEEERERQPRVTHLFDMETLEVRNRRVIPSSKALYCVGWDLMLPCCLYL